MVILPVAIKFSADIFIETGSIDIFPKLKMAAAAILNLLGEPWATHEGSCTNFVMIG